MTSVHDGPPPSSQRDETWTDAARLSPGGRERALGVDDEGASAEPETRPGGVSQLAGGQCGRRTDAGSTPALATAERSRKRCVGCSSALAHPELPPERCAGSSRRYPTATPATQAGSSCACGAPRTRHVTAVAYPAKNRRNVETVSRELVEQACRNRGIPVEKAGTQHVSTDGR